jgi:hypothetical protein
MRSGERCPVVPAPRAPEQLAAMEAQIAQTARQIAPCAEIGDSPLSTPDGWWCAPGQCRFWSRCLGGGTGRRARASASRAERSDPAEQMAGDASFRSHAVRLPQLGSLSLRRGPTG